MAKHIPVYLNTRHYSFNSLQKLIHKFLGIDEIVDHVTGEKSDIQFICVIADYAKELDSCEIEVLILREDPNQAYLLQLALKVAEKINKEIILYFNIAPLERQRIVL